MVTAVIALLLASQQLQVDATISRDRIEVGETVVLTITVEAAGNDPVEILNPSLVGLELLGSTDQSEVSIRDGVAMRLLTRELRLRATSAGTARIGVTLVQSGASMVQTEPTELTVVADESGTIESLAPHIRRMVESRRPPATSRDEVHVEVITSEDSIVLGDQLDLAVVAWFPQDIRTQLRTPPTLQPPQLQGAWTYTEGVPHAVDIRRRIGNTNYQMYVHSVVVFPLAPGELVIGPATVSYSMPMSYSFLSREVRHEPQSESVTIFVGEQPEANRPSSFSGAAGSGLQLTIEADEAALAVGDATVVRATLSGEGNVALWPEPTIIWPDAVRAYPEGVDVSLDSDGRKISGSKTFKYLVVPDSAGTHVFNNFSYGYYDLAARGYAVLSGSELQITADVSIEGPAPVRTTNRLLMAPDRGSMIERAARSMPLWFWLIIALFPPAIYGLVRLPPLLKTRKAGSQVGSDSALTRIEAEFREALVGLIGTYETRNNESLAASLRAAGIDAPIAAHAARVRERLWQANYGPATGTDPDELLAEVHEVLRALPRKVQPRAVQSAQGAAAFLMLLGAIPATLAGQSAEYLYEVGALRSAVDSFAARTSQEPWNVSHWYNLGAVLEKSGETVRARRAWTRAARIAPRNVRVRSAVGDLRPLDRTSARLTWVSAVSPTELFLAALVFWSLAWGIAAARRHADWKLVAVGLLAIALAGYGAYVANRYSANVALVLNDETPLREAPYGLAQSQQIFDAGMAVSIEREDPPWLLVNRGNASGWMFGDEVVPLQ